MRLQAIAATAALLAVMAAAPAHATTAAGLSRTPVAASERWKDYVLDPPGPDVYPRAAEVTGGDVQDPDGIKAAGGGATTLSWDGSGTAPSLVLDLGIDTGGKIEVGIASGTGAPVHLAYSEARRYLTPMGDNVEGSLAENDDPDGRFDVVPGVPGTASSAAIRGGERWISVTLDAPGTVAIDFVRVRTTDLRSSPEDYTGHFLSDDETVNRAWYASAYTFDAATDAGPLVLMDGAKRDRFAFIGDLTVGGLTGIDSVRLGPQVDRNTIKVFSCQQDTDGFIPGNSETTVACPDAPPDPTSPDTGALRSGEYIAWYVVAVQDYLERTGDRTFASALLPVLRRAVAYLRANMKDDLYVGNSQPGVEYGWQAGGGSGPGVYTNIVVYRALRALADLERGLGGDAAAARDDDAEAGRMRTVLMTKGFDASAGAFRRDPDGASTVHPQDANVEAVSAGLLDGAAADRALAVVRDRMWTKYGTKFADTGDTYISPYMGGYELVARLQRRDAAGALELIRTEWGHMLATDPNVTTWEKVGLDGLPQPNQANTGGAEPTNRPEGEGYVSLAHAWSTGPVIALTEYVLGLRPVDPGYATWTVDPQPGDLRWAQGQVGTPHGPLVSRWERGPGDRWLRLTAAGPPDTTGSVVVPLLGVARDIAMDGAIVWRSGHPVAGVHAERDGDGVRFDGLSGAHTFAWASAVACSSRRAFDIRLPRGLRGARVRVGGKAVRVRRAGGRLVARVTLTGRPRTVVTVTISGRSAHGRAAHSVRSYRTCVAR